MSIRGDTGRVHPAGGRKLSPAPAEAKGLSMSSVMVIGDLVRIQGPMYGH